MYLGKCTYNKANEVDLADEPNGAHRAKADEANKDNANEANKAIIINKAIGTKETN